MKTKIILLIICILALFLRFYNLGTNPPSLTWDETSWGYNAYTLATTGKDEFGKTLPVSYLESFGDFKPPMYAYLSIIPVSIFGLNEFSTRFVSALFGSVTILLSYFLVCEIFFTSKRKQIIALVSAFLLAISPWHILLSRAAFEANVATFFIILGVLLFLLATREKKYMKLLALSFVSYAFATYTFNTSRVFLPLFVPCLLFLKRKILLQHWKLVVISIIPAVVISIPLLLFLITPQAKLRYEEVNIFSDIEVIKRSNQEIQNDNNSPFSKIIHNRRLAYGVEYVKHYLDNLDPGFLFIHGDGNPKFSIQDVGQMYIWELPFIILGVILLFRKREGNWAIVPIWILLGIVPAATARETPHALRIETTLPMFQLISAYGLVYSYEFIHKKKKEAGKKLALFLKLLMGAGLIFAALSILYFIHTYFVHYPKRYASEWQYGYKEAISYTESHKSKYKNIYMTEGLGRPYIYALFYGNYMPNTLSEAEITREALGFVHVNHFGIYRFFNDPPFDKTDTLYINTPNKVPPQARILKKFFLPDGKEALVAYEK